MARSFTLQIEEAGEGGWVGSLFRVTSAETELLGGVADPKLDWVLAQLNGLVISKVHGTTMKDKQAQTASINKRRRRKSDTPLAVEEAES